MELIRDKDAPIAPLVGKTVAVIGYGNQGSAQALNLRDSGIHVIVGNRDDEYRPRAIEAGFETMDIPAAAAEGDVLLILTTDESQPQIWDAQIVPGVAPGNALVWASGYNVGYDLVKLPEDADAIMVAPRMVGEMVRSLYVKGSGAIGQFAVQQDATGQARALTLALCNGIGLTRGGAFESSFREEAELDLFAEQVVWAGLTAWFLECFAMGVEFGFPPELMVMELYASGEAAEILGLMAANGFFKQMSRHSTTSQYGTLSRGPLLINDEMRAKARELMQRDIRDGGFVKEWSSEQAEGSRKLQALLAKAHGHAMSLAEENVIPKVQAVHRKEEQQ